MIDLEVEPKLWVNPLVQTPILAARRAKYAIYPGKWPHYDASRACPGRVGLESAPKKKSQESRSLKVTFT